MAPIFDGVGSVAEGSVSESLLVKIKGLLNTLSCSKQINLLFDHRVIWIDCQ